MERYEAYKDSGVAWIGEIPAGWGVARLKFACSKITDGSHYSPTTVDDGIPYVTARDIHGVGIDYESTKRIGRDDFLALERSGCRPRRGDVLLVKDGATTGRTGLMLDDEECVILSSVASLRPGAGCASPYLRYALESNQLQEQIRLSMAGSAMPRITLDKLIEYRVLMPPLAEQRAIAAWLDEKTDEIDGLVADTEASIELLEEYRRSVISEAVTRGLDPSAPMKDSGVEWIGEIPEHWDVMRIKSIAQSRNGLDYGTSNVCDEDSDDAMLILRSGNIVNGRLDFGDCVYIDKPIPDELRVRKGDIVIVRTNGSRKLVGKSALIEEDLEATVGAFMLLCRSEYPGWLKWVLRSSMLGYYMGQFSTSTVNQMSNGAFQNMCIPFCPDATEQQAIAAHLDEATAAIDALVADKRAYAERLREYRKSLISEAVTGKFRVPALG